MAAYVIRRLLANIVILFGIVFVVFAIARLSPIDPVKYVLQTTGRNVGDVDPVEYAKMRHQLGLDRPILVQFGLYLRDLSHLNFGKSIINPGRSVGEILAKGVPVSLELAGLGLASQVLLGSLIGVLAASRQNTLFDRVVMGTAIIAGSVPVLVWGVLLIIPFGVKLHWFPIVGWGGPKHFIMPVTALTIGGAAAYARFTRAAVLEEIRKDFVRTAEAKGLAGRSVLFRHVLRNAMVPIVTFVAPSLAFVIYGNFVIETMFGIPGIAYYAITSTIHGDYPTIQATVLIFAFVIMTINLLTDVIYGLIDPRIRVA